MQNQKVKYPEFGVRMNQAADANPRVPLPNYGRLQWLADEMGKLGHEMTMETARKWFSGQTIPRQKAQKLLAQVLSVDPAWLTLGQSSTISAKEIKSRNALATGAVNLIAGMIQMAGWNIAFPDKPAAMKRTDLHAIIRGAQYSIHVAVGLRVGGDWDFAIPVEAVENMIIGLVQVGPFNYELIEMPHEQLEEVGRRKGGVIEVTVPEALTGWRCIESFAERI